MNKTDNEPRCGRCGTILRWAGRRNDRAIDYHFPLRPGFMLTIPLPRDLSVREAERIGRWLVGMARGGDAEDPCAAERAWRLERMRAGTRRRRAHWLK